jgi:signal transduction histidine kinase
MGVIWLAIGFVFGLLCSLPLVYYLLQRAEIRAREAERRALASERLAELGSMTGGLAHEIKNPLSTIGLNAQLLSEGITELELDEVPRGRLLRRVAALGSEVERLGGILTDFLQFAGRIRLSPERCDLVKLVRELEDFYHPQCDQAGIQLATDLPEESVDVMLDVGHIKQALLNLMINATQAITADESRRDGTITLRLVLSEKELEIHVIDNGPGISETKKSEIFRPYVSHRSRAVNSTAIN